MVTGEDGSENLDLIARVLMAADAEFGSYGVAGAKVSSIAQRSGLSVDAVYGLFPDKAAMASALAANYLADVFDVFGPVIDGVDSAAGIAPAIRRIVALAAELQQRHPGYYALTAESFPAHADSPAHGVREAMVAAFTESLAASGLDVPVDLGLALDLCIETTRNTLFTTPLDAPDRVARIEELQEMLVAYLGSRLGIAA